MVKEVKNHNKSKERDGDQRGNQQQTWRKVIEEATPTWTVSWEKSPRESQLEEIQKTKREGEIWRGKEKR
jgi:hypothetical protein